MRKGYVGMVFRGLRFGMLLHLAVGPICLLVLNTSAGVGFVQTLPLVAAVTLADALYVTLSCLGVAAIVSRPRVKAVIRAVGCAVLVLFGTDTLLNAFGVPLIPGVRLFSDVSGGSLFVKGLLLTLSNPLTILFWSGMLTAKVMENMWGKGELASFAAGCVLATVVFLTAVAAAGGMLGGVMPKIVITVLNAAVGAVLIYFGVRLLVLKK